MADGLLANKVVLVTGGNRGIGRAIAVRMAREGAEVALNHRGSNTVQAEEVAREIRAMGRQSQAFEADITQLGQIQSMVERIVELFGRIDVLVNNAGSLGRQPFLDISEEEWDRVLNVDLKGLFLVSQAVSRKMATRRSGRIINITSTSAHVAIPGLSHYQAAKAGAYMLTRGMALELAPYGILVNAIAPGLVDTEMSRASLADAKYSEWRLAKIPLGRPGLPQEIAGAAVYLASPEASFTTGTTITIDGGQTVQ